jgi:hypothetical protein
MLALYALLDTISTWMPYLPGVGTAGNHNSYNHSHPSGGRSDEELAVVDHYVSGSTNDVISREEGREGAREGGERSSKLQVPSVAMGLYNGGVGPMSRKGIIGNVTGAVHSTSHSTSYSSRILV